MKRAQRENDFIQIYDCLAYISINMMWPCRYGGKFGVQKDRMDKTAMGHDFIGKVDKHASQVGQIHINAQFVSPHRWDKYKNKFQVHTNTQTAKVDAAKGFGGKFGVAEQKDKSALGWDHLEKVEKHTSSKGNFLFVPTLCPL